MEKFNKIQKTKKIIAILQSNYIPWKGYFDLINSVDEFVILDDVQYTKRDWRNRNIIKTSQGPLWLSIPVKVKGRYSQNINQTEISDPIWAEKHWQTIKYNYAHAPFFVTYKNLFEELYSKAGGLKFLSQVNFLFIEEINEILKITTPITFSTDFKVNDNEKNQRLISICLKAGATDYLSGPAAQNYIDSEMFAKEGIALHWMDYSGYPEYQQLYPPFEHGVSIVDLILNEGPKFHLFMKSFKK